MGLGIFVRKILISTDINSLHKVSRHHEIRFEYLDFFSFSLFFCMGQTLVLNSCSSKLSSLLSIRFPLYPLFQIFSLDAFLKYVF